MSEEDVFDKMIKGASWDELKPYRKSKATFYKALDRYFFESELKFKEQQTKISEAEDKKRVAENASDEATKKLDELRGLLTLGVID